jgi:hypothetical protein
MDDWSVGPSTTPLLVVGVAMYHLTFPSWPMPTTSLERVEFTYSLTIVNIATTYQVL